MNPEEYRQIHEATCPHALDGGKPLIPASESSDVREFLRDANALETKVEHRWTARLTDREDGIVGTGETEAEAIQALASQYPKETP